MLPPVELPSNFYVRRETIVFKEFFGERALQKPRPAIVDKRSHVRNEIQQEIHLVFTASGVELVYFFGVLEFGFLNLCRLGRDHNLLSRCFIDEKPLCFLQGTRQIRDDTSIHPSSSGEFADGFGFECNYAHVQKLSPRIYRIVR